MLKRLLVATFCALLIVMSCKKDKDDPMKQNSASETFESVIEEGGTFTPVQKSTIVVDSSSSEKTEDGQRWRCTTTTYDAKDGAGGDGGFPMFNPNANVIYPGSLLQGSSLRKATPDVIAVDRAGGTISYDIIDGNDQSSFTVDEVKKSSITDAMNAIIGQSSGVIPANFNFTYKNIQSRQQFALAVQADYENAFLELEGYLNLNTDKSYSSYLVQLNQSYYTMSFDIPTSKDQLFAENVTPEDLAKYVGPGNPATYVSDVTYGRTYYMLIESTASSFDLEAGIRGSFSAIASSGGGSVDASYLSTLSNLKIQVFAYGGEASATLRTVVDASTLDSLVNKLASAGDIRSGKPVSYVVRSVHDNRVVAVQLANQYDVTNCVPIGSGNTPPAATSHWEGIVEDFGAIGAAVNMRYNRIALFNKAGNRYLVSEDNNTLTGPYELSDLGDGQIDLTSVGAGGVHRTPTVTGGVYFFNLNGNAFQEMAGATSFSNTSVKNIGSFHGGGCPFNAQGISGMASINVVSYNSHGVVVINKEGDEYSIYNTQSKQWQAAHTIAGSGLEVNGNKAPFTAFGAACYMRIGTIDYTVFFNKQGTQYSLWEKVDGFSPAYDL
ncbi:Thiol-activated cytolysin [Owenweeksia hongkongensis DSM 17368]|uniref:Thiol-activated cytolysin n=1 Tax=Owenweeksia hongkongensis (strain DSM 17368 / CIP 108786 / JCM 12287 / NRRL B-23963 / UST20020801) TaxID=926562 RepID=G8R5U3_OWEHD|nr:thiol-activated cytolysin family protein [Owenweeksia hongkongensis]AEV31091.1 Thiol-activated cytolysin [Owenweeksia hongkongensis DSM 17368]